MTLDEKIESIDVARKLAPYLDVKPVPYLTRLSQFVKRTIKNPLSALASTCAYSDESYGEEYFPNMQKRAKGDISLGYKSLGLETKQEQDAYRFVLAMQSYLRVYSIKKQELVTNEDFDKLLLGAAQSGVESVVYEYRSLKNKYIDVNPDFAENACKWLSEKIQSKLDSTKKVRLFDSMSISQKDNGLLIEK